MQMQPYEIRELYQQYKPLLFTLAYQLTGSALDAEDAVQDVFVKLYDVERAYITQPKAYLCKMVTNRCLDLIKSAHRRKELYFGMWLPEPILTAVEDPSQYLVRKDLLSYAVLVLLERLSPWERAVFVLRGALDLSYATIAKMLNKEEAACRKLFSRAKSKVGSPQKESNQKVPVGEEWMHRFIEGLMKDDINALLPLLAKDVAVMSDGGGKALAAVNPINKSDNVARYLLGLMRKFSPSPGGWRFELGTVNGQPGVIVWEEDEVDAVVLVDAANDVVKTLYIVRNPEKLRYLKGQIVI